MQHIPPFDFPVIQFFINDRRPSVYVDGRFCTALDVVFVCGRSIRVADLIQLYAKLPDLPAIARNRAMLWAVANIPNAEIRPERRP